MSTRRVDELLHIVPTLSRCSCGMSLREALGLTGIDTPALPAGHPVRAASPGPSGRDGRDGVVGGARESRVSRMYKGLGEVVEPFRNRPPEGQCPSVWLDALYLKVRHNHRIMSQTLVIATGVREGGEREVLGFALGAREEEAFWLDFLPAGCRDGVRSLVRRGLKGAQLVTSDAHEGLKKALGRSVLLDQLHGRLARVDSQAGRS